MMNSLLDQNKGHKKLTPGKRMFVSNIELSFERGTHGAQALVQEHRLHSGGIGLTLHILAGEAELAASLSGLGRAAMGVTWVSVTRKCNVAVMEVIMREDTPIIKGDFEVLALIKLKAREEDIYSDTRESDDEDKIVMPFQVTVKFWDGKSMAYDVYFDTTVFDLKKMTQTYHQLPPEKTIMSYKGQQLQDDKTLVSYGINSN